MNGAAQRSHFPATAASPSAKRSARGAELGANSRAGAKVSEPWRMNAAGA